MPQPGLKVRRPDGSLVLVHTPVAGVGPWFSFQRALWHRRQLEEMAASGLHSALVAYRGNVGSRKTWSIRAVDSLVQALKDMQRDGVSYPLVSLLLEDAAEPGADLTAAKGQQALYAKVRDFYLRVPSAFRLETAVPGGPADHLGNVVVLGAPAADARWDGTTIDALRQRFLEDFGKPLVIVGAEEWQAKAPNLDGYVSLDPTSGLQIHRSDRLVTATVSPGFDERVLRPTGSYRSRLDGGPFRADWNRLSREPVQWILLNSWNDFELGTEVAPSRQYWNREMTLVRIAMAALTVGEAEYRARLSKLNAEPLMAPKGLHRVEFTLENLGKRAWPRSSTVAVCQISKGEESPLTEVRLPLPRDVPARESVALGVGVPTAKPSGEPLEPGDYHLVIHVEFPAPEGGTPTSQPVLDLPLRVGEPAHPRLTLLRSDTPVTMMAGGTYRARIRLRNDTAREFSRAEHYVTYRWHRADGSDAAPQQGDLRSPLPKDLAPGEAADISVQIRAGVGDQPLALTSDRQPDGYFLEWGITTASGDFLGGDAPAPAGWEAVEVVSRDVGLDFSQTVAQRSGPLKAVLKGKAAMAADSEVEVPILIQNRGPATWRSGQVSLGYHWYYWDGTEMIWDSGINPKTPVDLPSGELAPGSDAIMARFKLKAPPFAGQYWLVVDGFADGEWASLSGATRSGEIYVAPVLVSGGPFVPQSLAGLVDSDGISSEENPTQGDLDGQGTTFPAEAMPPEAFTGSDLYPCGYGGKVVGYGVDSSRQVPFLFPAKTGGRPNFVTCRGQRVDIGAKRTTVVHLAAAALQDVEVDFVLHYASGTQRTQRVLLSAWNAPPKYDEHPVIVTPYRYKPTGPEPVPAYLNHYRLQADPNQQIIGITLPANPAIKILALTAEAW